MRPKDKLYVFGNVGDGAHEHRDAGCGVGYHKHKGAVENYLFYIVGRHCGARFHFDGGSSSCSRALLVDLNKGFVDNAADV